MTEDRSGNDVEPEDTKRQEEPFNYDDILEYIGPTGKFQMRICLLMLIPTFFPGVAVMSSSFTGAPLDYR